MNVVVLIWREYCILASILDPDLIKIPSIWSCARPRELASVRAVMTERCWWPLCNTPHSPSLRQPLDLGRVSVTAVIELVCRTINPKQWSEQYRPGESQHHLPHRPQPSPGLLVNFLSVEVCSFCLLPLGVQPSLCLKGLDIQNQYSWRVFAVKTQWQKII